ncbi:DsbA family oxidoreductase [Lactobacillus sp. PV037]|uniref:DsbA family oxidoreductase n=1 Tax=unclassified Lactobacillus TaxID=2620435 RepID=UPI00224012E9|nr:MULTISPECIES: DsbA family oxidoreductase [unclassified Lactobacillus]QNQ82405.1 DsbA family oxidoreductase [Lactobacillus sp. PV012]QNQ83482.1 DsbA family oxidoreductase [Lactobacillus sp. PV037]
MEVSIWIDYACPYCYVEFTRLQKAIAEVNLPEEVEINIHAAQINKNAPKVAKDTNGELLAKKDNLTEKEVKERFASIVEMGQKAGLKINYAGVKETNTMDAHRLVQWVEHGLEDRAKAIKLANLLFEANFTENVELADHQVLIDRAAKVGLDKDVVKNFLDSEEYRDLVIEQEDMLTERGVNSVPFMEINGQEFPKMLDLEELKDVLNQEFY